MRTVISDDVIRLTVEQRLQVIKREVAVLQETTKLLHRMLKDQSELITEYITKQVISAGDSRANEARTRPEDALYAFVCRKRFDRIEKELGKMRRPTECPQAGYGAI